MKDKTTYPGHYIDNPNSEQCGDIVRVWQEFREGHCGSSDALEVIIQGVRNMLLYEHNEGEKFRKFKADVCEYAERKEWKNLQTYLEKECKSEFKLLAVHDTW